jgi:hypothetical protein
MISNTRGDLISFVATVPRPAAFEALRAAGRDFMGRNHDDRGSFPERGQYGRTSRSTTLAPDFETLYAPA